MKNKFSSTLLRFFVFFWLCLATHFLFAATFGIAPTAISSQYSGAITLTVSGLTNGETVLIEKFIDANTNNIIDAADSLVQSFKITDGQASKIGGVTNISVPYDSNSATGAITAAINFHNNSPENIIGKYAFKLSSSTARFAAVTNFFSITNATFAQSFSGIVKSGGVAVPNATAILLSIKNGGDGHDFAGGAVANNSGSFTIKAAPGTYLLAAFKSNYVADFKAPIITLGSGATITTNLNMVVATRSISGKVVDAASTNIGIAGVFMTAEDTNNFIAVGYSDREGRFTLPVTAGQWKFHANGDGLASLGYLGLESGLNANTTTNNATNAIIALPKATALFYGSVKDDLNNPLAGVRISINQNNSSQYNVDGINTDQNGNYAGGVVAGQWDAHVSDHQNGSLTNFIFSRSMMSTNLIAGQTVLQNFTAKLATNRITGYVRNSSNSPIANLYVYANAQISGTEYQVSGNTDTNGNYSLNVTSGFWSVGVNCNGGDDSLNAYGYPCVNNQSVNLTNSNGTANFTVQPFSTHLRGRVVDDTGLAVTGMNIFAYQNYGSFNQNFQATTDNNGNFEIGIMGGSYSLQLNNDSSSGTPSRGLVGPSLYFTVIEGTDINNIVVVARRTTGQITGLIKDNNNTPLAFIDINAYVTINETNYNANARTDGNGHYSIGVFNGTWGVYPNCEGSDGSLESRGYQCTEGQGVTIQNNNGTANFTVQPCSPLQITTTNLPNATRGEYYYGGNLSATGCHQPFNWSLSPGSGPLPPGLSLGSYGYISGSPTTNGTFNFSLRVSDNTGTTVDRQFSITVSSPTVQIITDSPLPQGTVGSSYYTYLQVTGGSGNYTWSLNSGSALPSGLNLYSSGEISGNPTAEGTFNFSVHFIDTNSSATADKLFSLTVNPSPYPVISTTSLPNGTRSNFYSAQIMASGGQTPYNWSVSSSYPLPDGLSINPKTGVVSGTPTSFGFFYFLGHLTDFGGQTADSYVPILIQSENAPSNDLFANRIVVTGQTNSVTGSNLEATREAGEPYNYGQTVWWSWTAPITGTVTMDVGGGLNNASIGVYTGDSVSSLSPVVNNYTSSATFSAVAGTTYQIQVDGYNNGIDGSIVLNIREPSPPQNDLFANRIVVTGLSNTVSGSSVSATKETGEPTILGNPGGKSVWWSWIAPANGTATISTAGSSFDTLLAVYRGDSISNLVLVASNDDQNGSTNTSLVTFPAVAGTAYQIAVDGYSGTNGSIVLNIQETAAPIGIISLSGELTFGSVTVGSTSQRTLVISNTGNAVLTVSNITYPTGFSGNFSGTIAAGASSSVTVTFSPTSATSFGGNLTVSSSATSGTNTKAVSGVGTPAPTRIISLGGELTFGSVTVGSSAQRSLVISNGGNSTLTVSNISYPSGFSGNFSSGTIATGGSTNVVVTFSPTSATSFGGILTVDSDATSGINTKSVSGTGTNPTFAPSITAQPQSQSVVLSSNVTFSVTANGTAPLQYQWRKNGTNILNQTNSNFVINNVQTSNVGSYSVFISNGVGSITSSNATLSVVSPPIITQQPESRTVVAGTSVTFSVTAVGTPTLSYQWRNDTVPISGATNATFTLTNVQTNNAGSYSVVINNSIGSATSSNAVLTINLAPTAPIITTQPQSQTVVLSSNVTFSVTANGTAPLQYQWRKNGTNILNQTNSNFVINNVQTSNVGSYSVFISNGVGSIASSNATLSVVSPPIITQQPESRTVVAGTSVTFSVTAVGSPTLTYQWRNDTVPISGATNATFSLTSVQTNNAGSYSVVINNSLGSATSSNAVLTINLAPTAPIITTQPQSQTVATGLSATFSVTATGTAPLSFQWRKNGVNISGATSMTYNIGSVQTNAAGYYSVLINNSVGSVTSSNALLTVIVAPTITRQPESRTVPAGSNVTFYVTATGPAPLSYQWFNNGVSVSSATNASFTLSSVQTNNAGSYTVMVSNSAGSVTSAPAVLTVTVPPSITTQPQSQIVFVGSNVTFSVTASGIAPLQYQWRKGGVNISGATNASFTISNVQLSHAGSYTVSVSNNGGSVTSQTATLTVLAPPSITLQPRSVVANVNADISFRVEAIGTPPLTYQWFNNGIPVLSATNATLAFSNVQTNNAGSYQVTVSNSQGSTNSLVASLSIVNSPLDFDGDGQTDLLWQQNSGLLAVWFMNSTNLGGSSLLNGGKVVDPNWKIVGANDFDGDKHSDILWQHTNGSLAIWFMNGTKSTNFSSSILLNSQGTITSAWRVSGLADFNRTGSKGLVCRNINGQLSFWPMTGTNFTGTTTPLVIPLNSGQAIPTNWKIAGFADFNGDGKTDILWQSNEGLIYAWLMDGTNYSGSGALNNGVKVDTNWRIAALADFNQDGQTDLIWQHSSGLMAIWFMNGVTLKSSGYLNHGNIVDPSWKIVAPK